MRSIFLENCGRGGQTVHSGQSALVFMEAGASESGREIHVAACGESRDHWKTAPFIGL